ncbi:MAG: isoamylase early set domain-containing protein [Desulfobacterales bacterium]|nr:isoamylase early set domain-containing protein [Desulfobacterales bacterium]
MSIKKQYVKSNSVCKATFRLPKEAASAAKRVFLVGEFNNWDKKASPMKKLKNGEFKITMDLEPDRQYEFRYLIDEHTWENDWCADKYIKSLFSDTENSVIIT